MSQSQSKHNHNKNEELIPGSNLENSQVPSSNSGGTKVQNVSRNHISEEGNETRNNAAGGNQSEIRSNASNKPRSNPQGNRPMSVDGSQKGPGRKAD
ncbi:hypothetical protein F0P96_19820 [Hymenobacter busanensis]|uniref:Uncharacterized protein n=1 Tax=Hymenobacter busanensis TaxID=2607656 RepID=A0A7L4ZWY5_9BACT|nr:hypothetical protein [Hymenobacter busanensis]KAA9325577.1 hypothetical protein F0P96_19820 [Hymenobacter busanensis]QHJ07751.1 hypothetical protein GUY19_10845 [Hymenobacter busanensis]